MMEPQELRIERLEDLTRVAVNSQTDTLRVLRDHSARFDEHSAILKEHSRILNEHSEILKEHSEILNEHSTILNEHTAILKDHSARLENLEKLMARVLEELVAIREILSSPRGMGFTPESGS